MIDVPNVPMVDPARARELRQAYIDRFVNQESPYYQSRIQTRHRYPDGLYYDGYLWDCFRHPQLIPDEEVLEELTRHDRVYIMWDLHSDKKVWVENYFRFPKEAILVVPGRRVPEFLPLLPDDLYFFDDSLDWTVALTHEIFRDGSDLAYRAT